MSGEPALGGSVLHHAEFRLSFGECDPAGIVYYATYLHWAERIHTEWWFEHGFRVERLRAQLGATFVTRHVACDFHRSPVVMDRVRAGLSLRRLGTTSFTMGCRFTADDGGLLADQTLVLVFIDADRRPVDIPSAARQLLLAAGPEL